MKKALITSYIIIGILIAGLIFSFTRLNKLQNELWSMNQTINSFDNKSDEIESLQSKVYDLENDIQDLQSSDLESRVDDIEYRLDNFRFSVTLPY